MPSTLASLRWFILSLFLLGLGGTAVELLLLKHVEDTWQLVPLGLFGLSVITLAGWRLVHAPTVLRIHQVLMVFFIISGAAGTYLHYRAKVEFALERNAALAGWALLREALKGVSPPILAPGAMIVLGLLGLVWTYRHPALTPDINIGESS